MHDERGPDIEQLEELAALELNSQERARLREQLKRIVRWWDALNEIQIDMIDTTMEAEGRTGAGRGDDHQAPLPQQVVLDQAPERHGGFFSVPSPFGVEPPP